MGGGDGSLWIGTAAGLARWQNGQLVNYPETGRYVNAIIEDRNGTVWIALTRGDHPLCQVADLKTICYGQADGIRFPYTSASALTNDSLGNLWIAGASFLVR